jgi:hypothetical protein
MEILLPAEPVQPCADEFRRPGFDNTQNHMELEYEKLVEQGWNMELGGSSAEVAEAEGRHCCAALGAEKTSEDDTQAAQNAGLVHGVFHS